MNDPEPTIEHLDREQIFLIYATFAGCPIKTGAALGISPTAVLRAAEELGWLQKLQPIIELSKSQRPGDFERACNRAVNFADAHRMRLILQRTLRKLTNYSDKELTELLEEPKINKDGDVVSVKLTTRALTDLTAALEKMQHLTYAALGDSAPERAKRKDSDSDGDSVQDIHSKMAAMMAQAGMSTAPRALLLDAQVASAEALAHDASKKAAKRAKAESDPNNDDDH